jgi:peroxiredoxin
MPQIRMMLLLTAMTTACGLASSAPIDKPVDLTLRDLGGKRVRLRDYRGQIVVLNFWATWCAPCNEEMPMLVGAEREYRPRGVIFIGASLDEGKTRRNVPEFVSRYHIGFPIWVGATGEHLAAFGMEYVAPSTAFIDRDGRIASRVQGEARLPELKERIEWLLGDRSPPAPQKLINPTGY